MLNIKVVSWSLGIFTVVSFVLHWNPQFQWIKQMLQANAIGDLFYAEVDYWHNIGPQYAQYRWNVKKEIAGSVWLSAGCHRSPVTSASRSINLPPL